MQADDRAVREEAGVSEGRKGDEGLERLAK